MNIITTNDQLRRYIPNTFATVDGEPSLYDKIEPQIRAAETWFAQHLTPLTDLYRQTASETEQIYAIPEDTVPAVIVCEAFRNSVDSLNLVLTPNGFGIVSNDHVAPASKERTDNLKEQLRIQRDTAISQWLNAMDAYDWTACGGWLRFHETLHNFESSLTDPVRFEDWEQEQGFYRLVEDNLANKYISHPLMETLRAQANPSDPHLRSLRRSLAVIERNIVAGKDQRQALRAIVDYIRTATLADGVTPDPVFDCWRESPTAILWQNHEFQNDPKRGGVWL